MPDPGWPGTSEENAVRNISLNISAATDIENVNSFSSCPTCLGPNRTPTLHVGHQCISADSTDEDAVAEGADSKVNGASSSSSSELAKEQDNFDPLHKSLQRQLSLDESGKERAEVIDGVTAAGGVAQTVFAASSNPGPSSPVLKGKRKADDAEDSPPSLAKKNHRSAISIEADHSRAQQWERDWANRPVTIFRDLPMQPGTSSGTGLSMLILREVTPSALNLHGVEYPPQDMPMDIEPERATRLVQPPISLRFATFAISDEDDRMLTSSLEERYIPDPEGVGLEGRVDDILTTLLAEGNGTEEPNFMHDDDEEQQF